MTYRKFAAHCIRGHQASLISLVHATGKPIRVCFWLNEKTKSIIIWLNRSVKVKKLGSILIVINMGNRYVYFSVLASDLGIYLMSNMYLLSNYCISGTALRSHEIFK